MPTFACTLRLPMPTAVEARVREVLDCGFQGLGLEPPLNSFQWERVRGTAGRDVVKSLRLFLPYPRGLRPGEECPFRLGSLYPEEKGDALKYGSETVIFAERHAIPVVLLPAAARGEDPRTAFSSFLSTLAKLLDLADRRAVRLALQPASGPAGLPNAAEVEVCFREFEGAPLSLWLEAAAPEKPEQAATPEDSEEAQKPQRQANSKKPLWEQLPGRLAGVTLSRLDGLDSAGWESLRPLLAASPIWLLDPPAAAPARSLRSSLDFLEALARGPEKNPFV